MKKRYSREDITLGYIPGKFLYWEEDSDYAWFDILSPEEQKRIAKYLDEKEGTNLSDYLEER